MITTGHVVDICSSVHGAWVMLFCLNTQGTQDKMIQKSLQSQEKKSYVSRVCRVLETDTQVCSTTIQVTPTPDKNRGH